MGNQSPIHVVVGGILAGAFACAASGQAEDTTPITEVVMYAADGDTAELLRFIFATNEFEVIGEMVNQNGQLMEDIESLAYIPNGLYKGFYGVGVSGTPSSSKYKLARINPLDASVTVYGIGGPSGPLNYTRALTPRWFSPGELFPGEPGGWKLVASRTRNTNTECYLIVIDPSDGQIMTLPGQDPDDDGIPVYQEEGSSFVQLEGIAIDSAGQFFGTSYNDETKKSRLWRLDVDFSAVPPTATATSLTGYTMPERIEALEFAFGENTIDPSGLPAPASSWSHPRGVLLGFSDNEDTLVVMNADTDDPNVGSWAYLDTIYGEPIAFMSIDTEGIVFTTRTRDPNEPVRNPFD